MSERKRSLRNVAAACAAADTPADLAAAIQLAAERFDAAVAHVYRRFAASLHAERVPLSGTAAGAQAPQRFAEDHPVLARLPGDVDLALASETPGPAALRDDPVGRALLAPAGAADELLLRLGPRRSSPWLGIGLAQPGLAPELRAQARVVRALLADAHRRVRVRELDRAFAATAGALLERRGRLVLVADAEGRLQGIDGARHEPDGASEIPDQLLVALDRLLAREAGEGIGRETEISVPGASGRPVSAKLLARHAHDHARAIVVDLPRRPASAEDLGLLGLSDRQAEVLALILSGETTSAVGHRLGISAKTAQKHLEQAYRRLGAHSRLEALAQVLEAV